MSEEKVNYNYKSPSGKVDKVKLAYLMLQWRADRKKLDTLEYQIKQAVIKLGDTFDVADVRCTFNSGRTKYQGWKDAFWNTEESHERDAAYIAHTITEEVDKTDWKAVCEALGIEREVVSHGTPSATLKVLDD